MDKQLQSIIEMLKNINSQELVENQIPLISIPNLSGEYVELINILNSLFQKENRIFSVQDKSLSIINNIIHSGMWSMEFDTKGNMTKVTWSDKFRSMVGYKNTEDFPNTLEAWSDKLHPDHKQKVLTAYWDAVAGRSYYDVEYLMLTKDNTYKWFRATGEIERREDGSPRIFVGTFVDISLQKENSLLREISMREKEANEAKTRFFSHMSHDIRTPINGILGMISVADLYPEDLDKQSDCRMKIRAITQHLLSLINNVLDLSKLESVVTECAPSSFEINEIVESCINIIKTQAESFAINVHYSPLSKDEVHVIGPALYLKQILINLLSNAIKYNKTNGKIFLAVEQQSIDNDSIECQFKVTDTGIGMSEKFIKSIFDPFAQENKKGTEKFDSSGLGMNITKQLVEKMHGNIQVQSIPNQGSTFIVTLKFQLDHSKKTLNKNQNTIEKDLSGLNILLVDDNDINLEIGQCILENAGINVITAQNGQEALDCFAKSQKNSIDLILMDVMMPIMDGLEACRRIRRLEREDSKTVPILALTANAFTEDRRKAINAGMNEHISKPIDRIAMLQRISAYCKNNYKTVNRT